MSAARRHAPASSGRVARQLSTAVLAAGLTLVAATSCVGSGATTAERPAATASPSAPTATSTPRPTAGPTATGPRPLAEADQVGVAALTIAAIGLHASPLERLALLPNAELAAPKDPDLAGWYADGPVPGSIGPAVIAGHVDSTTGPAFFARLAELKPGDTVAIRLSTGQRLTFRVDRQITVHKDHFPTDEVYGPTPDAQLRLITCGGPYDRTVGAYEDNTVVFADVVEDA